MRFEIFGEPESESVLRFRLIKDSDGINVVVVDDDGDNSFICSISDKGMLLYGGYASSGGFAVDDDGFIKITT